MDDSDEAPRAGTAPDTDDGPHDATAPEDAFRTLAEDWIAIWQSEITAYLTDPETQQSWGAMMALWSGAAQTMMRGMPAAPGFGQGFAQPRPKPAPGTDERRHDSNTSKQQHTPEQSGPDAAPRPAPAADAPVIGDDAIRRLEQRVAELERSLADRDGAEPDWRRSAAHENRRTRRGGRPRS